MNCFYNTHKNKNKTIYQQFSLLSSKGHFRTSSDKISFITEKLIFSGLEDVTTIDRKWNEYNNNNECYNIETYLDFIISVVKMHNNNDDSFDGVITISEI